LTWSNCLLRCFSSSSKVPRSQDLHKGCPGLTWCLELHEDLQPTDNALSIAEIGALALAVVCISTGVALARPTFMAALSVHVPPQRQGVVMGTAQSLVAATDIVTRSKPTRGSGGGGVFGVNFRKGFLPYISSTGTSRERHIAVVCDGMSNETLRSLSSHWR